MVLLIQFLINYIAFQQRLSLLLNEWHSNYWYLPLCSESKLCLSLCWTIYKVST